MIEDEKDLTNKLSRIIKAVLLIMMLVVLLGLTGVLKAQTRNTVFTTVYLNSTGGASGNVQNIGQNFHQITVTVKNRTPSTCTITDAGSTTLVFEGSYDNVTFTKFSSLIQSRTVKDPYSFVGLATGIYPFIRLNITNISVNCLLDGYYAGSLYPISSNTLLIGTSQNLIQTQSLPGLGASTNTLLLSSAGDRNLAIYGVKVFSDATVRTSFQLSEKSNDGDCTTGTLLSTIFITGNLPVSTMVNVLDTIGIPYYRLSANSQLCLTIAPTGGSLTVVVNYKQEGN